MLEKFERKPNKIEKPPFLYHGSVTSEIKELEPRHRHTPYEEAGYRIYASHSPAFSAAHGFSWSSEEGFDTYEKNGQIVLKVPKRLKERLNVPIHIYKVPSATFSKTIQETTGFTWDSAEKVCPVGVERFNSVIEAVEHFGGKIVYK